MKNIRGSKKISVRAGTVDGDIFRLLVERNPVTKQMLVEPGLSAYRMRDGTTVEIFGNGSCYPDYLFSNGNLVISFQVDNIEKMVTTLTQKGASLLSGIETICNAYKYCHLLTNEKTVIGLYELNNSADQL